MIGPLISHWYKRDSHRYENIITIRASGAYQKMKMETGLWVKLRYLHVNWFSLNLMFAWNSKLILSQISLRFIVAPGMWYYTANASPFFDERVMAVWGAVCIIISSYIDAWRVPQKRVDAFLIHSARLRVPSVSKSHLIATRHALLTDASTLLWYNRHGSA